MKNRKDVFQIFFMVAYLLSPNRCNWEIAKVKNYNRYVTEVLDSTSKKNFPGIFNFTVRILTWSLFGQLKKPRWNHNTIYWNGAVYVIGGEHKLNYNHTTGETKTEIWKIKNSPYRFKTVEKMPILRTWYAPSLFIVSDSFFPNK